MKHAAGTLGRRGFTLLELLIVLTIIGILMGIGLGFTRNMGRDIRFEGYARAIKYSIILARNTAVAKNRRVSVRIVQTPSKRWKMTVVNSMDNTFDNEDDEEVGKPVFMKQVTFQGDQEIVVTPEGGFDYRTSNPLVMTDATDKNSPLRIKLTLYPGGGTVKIGPLEQLPAGSLDSPTNVPVATATTAS